MSEGVRTSARPKALTDGASRLLAATEMDPRLLAMIAALAVICVDDDPQAIRIMKMVLSGLRISQISTAKDGIHAREILAQDETVVHLIICDCDTLQLLKEVRNSHPNILFMVVTENVDAESLLAAKEAGVDAIIAKPVTVNQVEKKLLILARRL